MEYEFITKVVLSKEVASKGVRILTVSPDRKLYQLFNI